MKIIKIAQFEDEGHNIEETPEAQTFENQQSMESRELGAKGPTFTAQLIDELTRNKQRLNSAYVANGSVAWVKFKDVIYEVTVSPTSLGQHFGLFKELQNPAMPETDIQNEQL